MSKPTLLMAGNILPQKWMTRDQKEKLKNIPAIDWIMNYILDRTWHHTTPPKIKITGPGSKVSIFRSGTGTGKSTVIPPYLYEIFYEKEKIYRNIICTEPTITTAVDMPYQVIPYNPNLKLGENIGYQTGTLIRKPVRGIVYATVGILLQQLKTLDDKEFMKKYSFILLDEVHQRSIEADAALFYIRNLLERNYSDPMCPYVILMSGTLDPEKLMDFFDCPKDAFLDIKGNTFPIQDNFSKYNISHYVSYVIDLIEKIHIDNINDIINNEEYRDILVFVQGMQQIIEISDGITKLNNEIFAKGLEFSQKHVIERQAHKGGIEKKTYYLCPIIVTSENMQKGNEDYKNIYSDIQNINIIVNSKKVKASRKVLIATNAIETGMTIDSLKYCIDTGYLFESQFNPNYGINMLLSKNISQSSSIQRRGRVGRKHPGQFFACYTKETFDHMQPQPIPDILKSDITTTLLDIIISETETKLEQISLREVINNDTNYFQMNKFDNYWYKLYHRKEFDITGVSLMQVPSVDTIRYSMEKMRVLGFIDASFNVTLLGWFASKLRKISLEQARMLFAGYQYGARVLDLITIICFSQLSHKLFKSKKEQIYFNPFNAKNKELYHNFLIMDDFIEYIFIWDKLMDYLDVVRKNVVANKKINYIEDLTKWCDSNNLNIRVLMLIIKNRDELIMNCINAGINPFYNGYGIEDTKYNLSSILVKNLSEGMDEVTKIKKCLYEGYRLNIYLWNNVSKTYISHINKNPIKLSNSITNGIKTDDSWDCPQKIIVGNVVLRQNPKDITMYEFTGNEVSVLDGFVDIDLSFTE